MRQELAAIDSVDLTTVRGGFLSKPQTVDLGESLIQMGQQTATLATTMLRQYQQQGGAQTKPASHRIPTLPSAGMRTV